MRLLHTADLHLGKQLHGYSLFEDQVYILGQILDLAQAKDVDAILLSGDIYDRSNPAAQSVRLFDEFLTRAVGLSIPVLIISGNHDSADRLAYANRLVKDQGVYIAPSYTGAQPPICLEDEVGPVYFYLLPFIKPVHVNRAWPEEDVHSYDQALTLALHHFQPDFSKRNVLLAHQFVTGALQSDSEEISLGGSDNVGVDHMEDFDYVALGHIHRPQKMVHDYVRYAGSPLKYSISEAPYDKSVSLVDLGKKGDLDIQLLPLTPLRDVRVVKGTWEEVSQGAREAGPERDDFIQVILQEEEEVPEAMGRLRLFYPHILQLNYDNKRNRKDQSLTKLDLTKKRSPEELFAEFYELQNNQALSTPQAAYLEDLVEEIWEGEE